jgi:DNA invertase Pin-like site-specific DNA recombinase
MKAITRREFDMVAAWSVDRLGRSLQDLVGFLSEVHGPGVDLYLISKVSIRLHPQAKLCSK